MRVNILGIQTDAQSMDEAVETILNWIDLDEKKYVCTCPVYTLMIATEQPEIKHALSQADMVTADGMPIVWVQRYLGAKHAQRVYGPDLLLALCEHGVEKNVRHYFWGGEPGIAEQLSQNLMRAYPGLQVAGMHSPPIAELESEPNPETIALLNEAGADIIWVGLGSPKQDMWAALYRSVLEAPVIITVGAAFDFISGAKRQAPRWMQRTGLEWLFRLLQEPRRLWKRYLIYNPRFLYQIFREYVLGSRS